MENVSMACLSTEKIILAVFAPLVLLFILVSSDGHSFSKLLGRSILGLGVLAAICSLIEKWWSRMKSRQFSQIRDPNRKDSQEQIYLEKQKAARMQLQEQHNLKANTYNETILKPRERAEQEKKEKEFYRFAGPSWKCPGNKLMSNKEEIKKPVVKGGSSRDAALSRVLPDEMTKPSQPKTQLIPTRRKITLPEEPVIGCCGSLRVALRTPQGTVQRRRFLISNKIQVLFDYMTKIGYHQNLYTLTMPFPRKCLDSETEFTLEDMDITKDIALNIERRDTEL